MTKTASKRSAKLRAQAASGVFVDFAQVTNNQSPHPSVWSASVECKKRWENGSEWRRHVHNGDEFVNVETELVMSIRWDQVAAYFPPQQSSEKLLIAPREFSRMNLHNLANYGRVGGSWRGLTWRRATKAVKQTSFRRKDHQ